MTTLIVPGYVDDAEMIKQMCRWILTNLGPDYPLHFYVFSPDTNSTVCLPLQSQPLSGFASLPCLKESIMSMWATLPIRREITPIATIAKAAN